MIPSALRQLSDAYFDANAQKFNLTENSGCGMYMESFIPYAQTHGYPLVGFLKKNPGQTQFNGHANDAFLYADGVDNPNGLWQAVDVIANAESKPPYNAGHQPPAKGWSPDEPRYSVNDWMKEANANVPVPAPINNTVPWIGYPGDTANSELKRILSFDYSRRPQGADWDISVWAFRVMYTALMGLKSPNDGGLPLGVNEAVTHHRPEWCGALGVLVIPVPTDWVTPK